MRALAAAWALVFWLAGSAGASIIARIDQQTATGTGGRPVFVIDLYRGVGFDISLLATGEKISDWWVEDPSRVVARTDRTGQILSLRLVNLPTLLPSNRTWTTLKILTSDSQGRMNLLHFAIRFQDRVNPRTDEVRYHGLEILPASQPPTAPTALH
ncbi:hypothetical protein [Gloeobacter kilaueensis]|uniref:Uncharacterized protein n=1 Tax=Gloeobacter kilaueensis (strain ATCC BAA-2537 / CCAP 1431/1 / ULC 316 / JS1) TaxID=1183438 RepID=U5QHW1_GLOK1|nr:hypothetical protein [Gloeobacter kilaueensis]AGY57250.1 hypothetical protein GKIL_1004 [Gloeobacter kilaueensis JS1]